MNAVFQVLALGLVQAMGGSPPRLPGHWAGTAGVPDRIWSTWIVTYPERARDSIRVWLTATTTSEPQASARLLAKAEQLGMEYAKVWGDSFPLHDARRFAGWPDDLRRKRVRADSLRRAGNAALGREGFGQASKAWRASLGLAAAIRDTAAMAAALGNIGAGFYRENQLDSASHYFGEARQLAASAGDRRTELNALGGLASVSKDRRDYRAAAAQYKEALGLGRQVGDYRGVAADANNMGLVALATGDSAEARRRHVEALITAREHGFDDAAAVALLNLGVLGAAEGNDRSSEKRYSEALALYRKLDDPADEALVLRNLGLLEAGQNNYPGAAERYRAAVELLERSSGPVQKTVGVRLDLSQVLAVMGNLDEADRELRASEQLARQARLGPALDGRIKLARGDLALEFNRVSSARELYEAGSARLREAKDSSGEGDALAALGELSLMEENFATSDSLLSAATALQGAAGDGRSAALTGLLNARAARGLGDIAKARRLIAAAIDTLHASGDKVAEAWARCEAGDLERTTGALGAAEASYRFGLERLGRTPSTSVAVCLYSGLGLTLRARGAARAAIVELQRGIAATEATATEIAAPDRRADFLSDKWSLYADLVLVQRSLGADSAAFETSERLRAQQTLALVAGPSESAGPAEADPRLTALSRRITQLMDASALHETAVALRGPDALVGLPNQRRDSLARTEMAYTELLDSLDLDRSRPRSNPPDVPDWRQVATRLSTDQALIEYLLTDSSAMAFVITPDRLTVVNLPATGAELAGEVDFVRGMLRPERTERAVAWRGPLRKLHDQLMTPVEAAGLLDHVQRLIIVPHRELHYLPFAALLGPGPSGRFLVQRYEYGVVSSAAVWLALRARVPGAGKASVLALAPRDRDLPGARSEVRAIAQLYGSDADLLVGDRATSKALASEAPGHSIIHLASLGVLNRHNPQFSYVALAPDEGTAGRLEVHEVARLSINARLVVLSACQTGLGSGRLADVPPGDDWVGMVQAFQSAGARTVLASLWPVDDQATGQLMKRFYSELRAGNPEPTALAIAQRSTLSAPGSASPFYWAGFVLDGGL